MKILTPPPPPLGALSHIYVLVEVVVAEDKRWCLESAGR
jgi:hypothetical protein